MPQKGKYIILDGGDGCGKSTQAQRLVEHLNDKHVLSHLYREPGSTPEAEKIRNVLLNKENDLEGLTEIFLFEAARTEFFRKELIPKINSGITIVSDRSFFSTLAYQGFGGGLSLRLIEQLNDLATFPLDYNLAFVLDVESSKGLSKEENADRFAAKGKGYHERVNQGFREIARTYQNTVLVPYREIEKGKEIPLYPEIRNEIDKLF